MSSWSVRLSLIVLWLAACHSPPAGDRAPRDPAPQAAARPGDRVELPPGTLPPHGTLLLGDVHGTEEIPAFIATLVTTVAAREPVVLGLEIEAARVPSLAAYLASDGSPSARDAALHDAWWVDPYQDGRRSVAMFALLDRVRRLRAGGAPVDLVLFDHHVDGPDGGPARDKAMADDLIAARAAHPDAAMIVYAGNLHVIRKGVGFAPGYQWMAMHLAAAGIPFTTINVRYASGKSWVCQDDKAENCGAKPMKGAGDERGIRLAPSADGNYDGWYGVGPIRASPPAALTGKA